MNNINQSADVAAVKALETQARALLEALTADEAIGRLDKADYPGAGYLCDLISDTLGNAWGSLAHVCEALEMMRSAEGNPAAWDLGFHGTEGEDVDVAVKNLLDCHGLGDEGLARAQAMRQYAATVA